MVSNAPFVPGQKIRRLHYRDVEGGDLKPSGVAWCHGAHRRYDRRDPGAPDPAVRDQNTTVALLAALFMVFFHLFIASTFPLAVPLEWNVVVRVHHGSCLFLGYPAGEGYSGPRPLPSRGWLPVLVAALAFFPVLGNLRPDLVFLPSMRQYAGNWASATWAFAPGAEARLNELPKAAKNQVDQLPGLRLRRRRCRDDHADGGARGGRCTARAGACYSLLLPPPRPTWDPLHDPRG